MHLLWSSIGYNARNPVWCRSREALVLGVSHSVFLNVRHHQLILCHCSLSILQGNIRRSVFLVFSGGVETLEGLCFSGVFRRCRKWPMAWSYLNEVIQWNIAPQTKNINFSYFSFSPLEWRWRWTCRLPITRTW